MGKQFEIRREVELSATPEEVWEAVATGAGNAAWLFPNEVEPREGATNADGSTVTAWDPPRRFEVRVEGEEGVLNALEFVIEGRAGGRTVLRYVHSGILGEEDWDTQYDAAKQHTDFYLHTLGEYLRHFGGRTATYVGQVPGGIEGPPASAEPGAFDVLRQQLGLTDGVAEGDEVSLEPRDLERLDGVVDYVRPNFLGLRTADGLYCFFGRNAFGSPVGVSLHLFADDVDKDATERAWHGWLQGAFAGRN
jgi:uncharacterized protein YndB with AHSA1/START domain